jgi:hypothetical protein
VCGLSKSKSNYVHYYVVGVFDVIGMCWGVFEFLWVWMYVYVCKWGEGGGSSLVFVDTLFFLTFLYEYEIE